MQSRDADADRLPSDALVEPVDRRKFDVLVGKRLRLRRMILRLSQEQLAGECGVSPQQVHKYETGQSRLSTARLIAFAAALDVSVAWFFDGLGDLSAPPTPRSDHWSQEAQELMSCYGCIRSPARRRKLLEFARLLRDEIDA